MGTVTENGDRQYFPPRNAAKENLRWQEVVQRMEFAFGMAKRRFDWEIKQVEEEIDRLRRLDYAELDRQLDKCRAQVRRMAGPRQQASRRAPMVQSLALIAVASERGLGVRPFKEQLLAARAMYEGAAVQLAPGEGKTLSIAIAAILQGWSGRPCHVVTANDYLAGRDAANMQPLYSLCGLQGTAIGQETSPEERAKAYWCDVVYATSQQLLADFQRDRIRLQGAEVPMHRRLKSFGADAGADPTMLRGLFAAIIDEADSVLVDDATTPMIISTTGDDPVLLEAIQAARDLVDALERGEDYHIDENTGEVGLTERGELRLDELTDWLPSVWHGHERRWELVSQAIIARDFFLRDQHYVIEDGAVVIVDENTGRMMRGRSWSYGLHQAIEAYEGLELSPPSRTLARMSFQDFFRSYHRLAGASGTLQGVERELWNTYGLAALRIPPRRKSRLYVAKQRHFLDPEDKVANLVEQAVSLHKEGLPVLVGTRRIPDSEAIASALENRGVGCVTLNAKQHEFEAQVIAEAGWPGRVTVATNMAGRGSDILLGEGVAERGGLQVLMLEPHEAARVDWQFFGRAGRQGEPGRVQPFVSMGDDLLQKHVGSMARPLYWSANLAPLRGLLLKTLVPWAQHRAQKLAWRQRRQLVKREAHIHRQLSFTGRLDMAADAK